MFGKDSFLERVGEKGILKKYLWILFGILVLLIAGSAGYLFWARNHIKKSQAPPPVSVEEPAKKESPTPKTTPKSVSTKPSPVTATTKSVFPQTEIQVQIPSDSPYTTWHKKVYFKDGERITEIIIE